MHRSFVSAAAALLTHYVVLGLRNGRREPSSIPFDKALFMATHNSYEKKVLGIKQQLDFGVRMIEFDIWLHEFESRQEYCVAHRWCMDPTTQVGELGNPSTHYLNEWLMQIRDWSSEHPDHAPITVMMDMKNDLTGGGRTFAKGGISNVHETVRGIFGDQLYWRSSKPVGEWPSVDSLRGKVIAMLSGHRGSRIGYQQDEGRKPQVATNSKGLVVEVHESPGHDQLYYWTGKIEGNTVSWHRHGKFDSGKDSWPAIGEDNTVVEVHRSASMGRGDDLWYNVGTLDPSTLEIQWGSSVKYDKGVEPTVRILGNGQLEERHKSQKTGKVWVRKGAVDAANKKINWLSNAVETDVPLFTPSGSVEAKENAGILEYRVRGEHAFRKICYPQMFFMDWQVGCSGDEENYAPLNTGSFIGVSHKCSSPAHVDGVATRVWQYSSTDKRSGKWPGVYPATDEPDDDYKAWVASKPEGIVW